jgi:hypothetical protein
MADLAGGVRLADADDVGAPDVPPAPLMLDVLAALPPLLEASTTPSLAPAPPLSASDFCPLRGRHRSPSCIVPIGHSLLQPALLPAFASAPISVVNTMKRRENERQDMSISKVRGGRSELASSSDATISCVA